MPNRGVTRREFVEVAGRGAAALVAAPAVIRGIDPLSEPVRVGHIGLGVRGGTLINQFAQAKGATVVAVCDVYEPHLQKGVERAQNPDVKTCVDYREVLDDPRVEAVVIATPDHWHEQILIDAAAAGKDVYCEKGWTMSIAAAKRMRDAIRKNGTVMQLGHQGRQLAGPIEAGKRIRDGALGPVTMVHTGRYFNGSMERPPWRWYGWYSNYERPDPKQVVAALDWERWLGPAPKIAFNERHFWHWRCYWPYGTGQAGDLLSHELDHVQSVLGYGVPDTCMCAGLNAVYDDDREVPDTWLATYQFEKHRCTVHFEGVQNSRRQQPPEYCGKDARLIFNTIGQSAGRFAIYPDADAWGDPEPVFRFDPESAEPRPSHAEDFLQCVRTRQKPQCNEDEAFIETATYLMSVESYRRRRQVRWDPEREEIV